MTIPIIDHLGHNLRFFVHCFHDIFKSLFLQFPKDNPNQCCTTGTDGILSGFCRLIFLTYLLISLRHQLPKSIPNILPTLPNDKIAQSRSHNCPNLSGIPNIPSTFAKKCLVPIFLLNGHKIPQNSHGCQIYRYFLFFISGLRGDCGRRLGGLDCASAYYSAHGL